MSASSPGSPASYSSKLLQLSRLVFTPVSIGVITWFIWLNKEQLAALISNSNGVWLITSIFLWAGSHLVSPLTGTYLLQACEINIPYSQCLRIHCSRLPAKYLPGGIWHSVGRANDYLLLGHTQGKVARFFLVENLLLVCVTFAISAPLVSNLISVFEVRALVMTGALLAALAVAFAPLLLRLLSRNRLAIGWHGYLMAIPALVLYWCIVGFSFSAYLTAFADLSLRGSALETVAVYVFSWCMGYLAIFAPQGVGVMEFVSGYLLDGSKGLQLVGLIAGFRLVILVTDIATWLVTGIAGGKR